MTTGSGGTGEDGRLRRAAEFLRRHPGVLVVVAVLGLVVVGVLNRTSGDGDEDDRNGGAVHEPPSRKDEDSDQSAAGASDDTSPESATTDLDAPRGSGSTTTTVAPPDVARPRPSVDLETPPDGSDPVEVARWWAAVYVSYVGAEPGDELAQRLERLTTPSLRQDLASMPPGASYNDPIPIEGVTAGPPTGGASSGTGDDQSQRKVRVVVETPGALVVYNLVLEQSATGWQVGEATRL